jgi:hypothetical protein
MAEILPVIPDPQPIKKKQIPARSFASFEFGYIEVSLALINNNGH